MKKIDWPRKWLSRRRLLVPETPLIEGVGWCYSAVLSVFHVSSCRHVVLLPKSAEELYVVCVHSSQSVEDVFTISIECIPWSLPK